MKPIRYLLSGILLIMGIAVTSLTAQATQTVYTSPYVTMAPDGKAWTTNAGDKNVKWYSESTVVTTGIESAIRALKKGEHYYWYNRIGKIPIGRWKVEYRSVNCCHDDYPPASVTNYHGVSFGRRNCLARHYSAWHSYCADCETKIEKSNIYMSKEAADSIDYFEVGTGLDYYYLCPFCNNLEQAVSFQGHECKAISYNQYKVTYDANAPISAYGGFMLDSYHMYNNAMKYEGKPVTPVTHLSKNVYTVTGYEFVEWNTEPDGSGEAFADKEEILNLSDKDAKQDGAEGVVTLYAQWRKSSSTLNIDPNGGTYDGRSGITVIKQNYLTPYNVNSKLVKAPAGYKVSFHTNGGNVVASITGTRHFTEWKQSASFEGHFANDTYIFKARDGNEDTLSAIYEPDAITLPSATKAGSSFGGWYYDPECTEPAGGPGDQIIPSKDITLYAGWVDLKLSSRDNYSANNGKGAVNLSWTQSDKNNKTYKLYQSKDSVTWKLITSANDIGNSNAVSEDFAYSGSSASYTVPYSGIYTLTAYGAQGGSYGSYQGGSGGSASIKVWLEKGEIITYNIGGKNGYNGGGTGVEYGNGGGATKVSSNKKGTLLVAGGGGGAGAGGNGGAGGSETSLRTDKSSVGASGQAGGGGGYVGGNAGEKITHHHQKGVCAYHEHTGNSTEKGGCYQTLVVTQGTCTYVDKGWRTEVSVTVHCDICNAQSTSTRSCHWYAHSACGQEDGHWGRTDCGAGHTVYTWGKFLSGTHTYDVYSYALSCGVEEGWHCQYTEGQVISSKPAYGGSNYVNASVAYDYSQSAGVHTGNGAFSIRSEAVGYLDELSLNNVAATDFATPDSIDLKQVQKTAVKKSQIKVTWAIPKDNGTDYYHKAESYLRGSNRVLCESNITMNTLTSGIKGYYYILNKSANTTVTASAGTFLNDTNIGVNLLEKDMQYLHVAAVDVADNVSKTVHIQIEPMGGSTDKIAWSLYTQQMTISSGENVYQATDAKTYYVRSDGSTPYTLSFKSGMDGTARSDYQINYSIFETDYTGSGSARNIIYTPSHPISNRSILSTPESLAFSVSGRPVMQWFSYTTTERSNLNCDLNTTQQFVLDGSANGKKIRVTPIAGADFGQDVVYSDIVNDRSNSLTLIADGEAPDISGMEVLEQLELINRNDATITLNVTASDDLSGIRDFYLEITNTDNGSNKTYTAGEDGNIKVEITGDKPIFSGDFQVRAYAVDNVGNETEVTHGTTEFALSATIERILEPHDPIFKCGESGSLSISTYGYAERVEVEFPPEMVALQPGLNKVFNYSGEEEYVRDEKIQFMIPLYTPANTNYKIIVRAYKGDKHLEKYPTLGTIAVGGSILDEFRTRLR